MLKASLQDIPILSGYLHDAYFKPEDITFNADQQCFKMILERACYEQAQRGKLLFFIPVIRYPWIRSCITMTGVETMVQEWIDHGVDGPDNKQMILDVEQKTGDGILIRSAHLNITLRVTADFKLILEDNAHPLKGPRTTDFFKCVFCGITEIDKLRVNND